MGVARDKAKAMALYKKACIGGEMTGCYDLGVCDQVGCGVARDEAKAAALFQQACSGGVKGACLQAPAQHDRER
jgi:hypothetical protein